jgi:hypothetical protein
LANWLKIGEKMSSAEKPVLSRSVHISGLGANPDLLSSEQKQVLNIFRRKIDPLPEVETNRDYVEDSVLINFLVARDWDIPKATKMLISALQWRTKRLCHRWCLSVLPGEPTDKVDGRREELFSRCGATGKIRVPGTDRHGKTNIFMIMMLLLLFFWAK